MVTQIQKLIYFGNTRPSQVQLLRDRPIQSSESPYSFFLSTISSSAVITSLLHTYIWIHEIINLIYLSRLLRLPHIRKSQVPGESVSGADWEVEWRSLYKKSPFHFPSPSQPTTTTRETSQLIRNRNFCSCSAVLYCRLNKKHQPITPYRYFEHSTLLYST